MKISGIKKIKPEIILKTFQDFKNELLSNSIHQFSYDNFIEFVNRPENKSKYSIIAYKWHRDENQLENENYPCSALSVFNLFLAFSDRNNKAVIDEDGKKIKMINKIGEKLFEFVD